MTKKRRRYTSEQKAEAVKLVEEVGNLSQVSRDLGVNVNSLRQWVEQAKADDSQGPGGALDKSEREELIRLRREFKRVKMERDFLKKASAYFAKQNSERLP